MTQLGVSGRPGKILDRFPAFMRVGERRKTLGHIATALGRRLDEDERLMAGINRSHRLGVADEERDVLQLAALLGFDAADFSLLRRFYDRGLFDLEEDEEPDARVAAFAAYNAYLAELKEAVRRSARLFLDGCGTIWALIEGAAILTGADVITRPDGELVEHPDKDAERGGFIHRAGVGFRTIENGDIVTTDDYLYLLENPLVDRSTEDKERRQQEWFRITRRGFFDDPVAVKVAGVAARTVKPMIVSRTRHEGVGYNGVVAGDKRLVFATDGKVYLEGADVTAGAYYFRGALMDYSTFDSAGPDHSFVTTLPEGAMNRNYPRPGLTGPDELPVLVLPLGESHWRFSIEEGAFDASGFEESVFDLPGDLAMLQALPASGRVQLGWREHRPFAAVVLIPAELKALETELLDDDDLLALVRAGLEKFRAAGIDVDVAYFNEEWILNDAVIRDMDATSGEGLFFSGTNLGGPE